MHPILTEEINLLRDVSQNLRNAPEDVPPREREMLTELVRLRDEIPTAKADDQAALLAQYHQLVSQLESIRAGRDVVEIDLDSPYFGHLRLRENGRVRDLCLGKGTKIAEGVRIVDWRNAPISKVFYRYAQGDEYEEIIGGRTVCGEVVARRTVTIREGELERVDCPEGVFVQESGEWSERARETPRLLGGEGAALRAHRTGEGGERRLGTDLEGHRRRSDKRLPDVAGLLDPEQFGIITRPSAGFVVVRGSAGSGKTTVALHRIAWLAFDDPSMDSERTLFLVFSAALRDYVGHVLPALGVHRVQVRTFRDWASNLRKRHFPMLPRAYRDDTPALVLRLKLHPVMNELLADQVQNFKAPATPEQAIDDWASVLTEVDHLRRLLQHHAPGEFRDAEVSRIAGWCRERHRELAEWREGDKSIRPELDPEDDTLLLRAWQLRVGPLRHASGGPLRHRHIALDEVQDYSPLEVRVLLDTLDEKRSITLAGDTQQHVMQASGFTDWTDFFRHLGVPGTTVDTLRISYRCSHEITAFALALLGDLREDSEAPMVTRTGPPVELFEFTDLGANMAFLAEALVALVREEPLASVVLLTPDPAVSRLVYGALREADVPRVRLVESQTFTFQPGIEVTEIESVKGLEFDYVVLLDVSAAHYPDVPTTRRRLHVGATRAVHQLWMTCVGPLSPVVRQAITATG